MNTSFEWFSSFKSGVSHDDDDLVHVHNIHQQEKGIKM
jgi:hypothetical protein